MSMNKYSHFLIALYSLYVTNSLTKDPRHSLLSKAETRRAQFIPASNSNILEGPAITVSQVLKQIQKVSCSFILKYYNSMFMILLQILRYR